MLLVLLAVFTLLSLITGSRGQITDAWIGLLVSWFGMGVWGLPLVMGALGLWIVIRAIERMPDLPWQRPAGSAILLLAYIIAATLLLDEEPLAAGGQIGLFFASNLESAIGLWGAWSVVTMLTIVAIALLTDRLLLEMAQEAGAALQELYQQPRRRPRLSPRLTPQMPTLKPMLPIPSGELPWWKQLRERFQRAPALPSLPKLPPNLVSATPRTTLQELSRQAAPTGKSQPLAAAATPTAAPAAPRLARTDPLRGDADLLVPRIVGGGGQEWRLPRLDDMLINYKREVDSDDLIRKQGRLIQETLALFGVPADFEGAYKGPSVTQYLIKPGYTERNNRGETQRVKVKVSKIAGLSNDLALALAAPSVRIEAPIPGTNYVGVEVPNTESNIVGLKELMESDAFQNIKGNLRIALGEDVKGQPIVSDLARMPHLLIAGATGSGKSACINSIISCLLLTHTPDSLRFLMVDPKMVELSTYNGIPHLLSPVVTEVDKAAGVLFWGVKEMERRYQLCSKAGVRDLVRYNEYLTKRNEKPLPYIVVIVDEMADLMMAAPEEVEKHICRLAQMSRAVGIHLIIATQRPSVDVITGLIKANFPARVAFAVSSQVDSRVVLDVPGAERLLGRGDMLFMGSDSSKLERIQGTWVGDEEINKVVRFWKGIRSLADSVSANGGLAEATPSEPEMSALGLDAVDEIDEMPSLPTAMSMPNPAGSMTPPSQPSLFTQIEAMKAKDGRDELFDEAIRTVKETGRGSVSLLQRKLRIGYSRASRLVDQLEEAGILGPDQGGTKGRPLLIPGNKPESSQPSPANPPEQPPPRIIGGTAGSDDEEDGSSNQRPRVWM